MFLVPTFGVASFKSVNNSNGYTVAVSALLFSLVTKDVEHLFRYLLTVQRTFAKSLLRSFPIKKNWLLLLLLSCNSYLYILDTRSLADVFFFFFFKTKFENFIEWHLKSKWKIYVFILNIFAHSVAFLLSVTVHLEVHF